MSDIERLLEIMRRLRDPQTGCPWDREQTLASIVPHTIEEAYEVAEAIEQGDMAELAGELGDLLFQVVFYARIAEEEGDFAFGDVVRGIVDKLVRRHPHVFGSAQVRDARDQSLAWERHKEAERRAKAAREQRPASVLDGVGRAQPALTRAARLQKRAARVGFDWPDPTGVLAKIREETAELEAELTRPVRRPPAVAAELGDLLFTCVNLARHLHLDPEEALRKANGRFEARFRRLEALLGGPEAVAAATPAELEALWERVKAEERGTGADE